MNLVYIKTTACPHCGCDTIVHESVETGVGSDKVRRHVNGQSWEHRKWACGHHVAWSPPASRETVRQGCPKRPGRAAMIARRKALLEALRDVAGEARVDAAFRKRVQRELENINPEWA